MCVCVCVCVCVYVCVCVCVHVSWDSVTTFSFQLDHTEREKYKTSFING